MKHRGTVALTGASGHLGRVLAEALLQDGWQLRALVHKRRPDELKDPRLTEIHGSVLEREALRSLLEGADVLIHCAAVISLEGDPDGRVQRVNVEGTRRVLDTAHAMGVPRTLHISSIHAFDPYPQDSPLNETRALCPPTSFPYDRSKRAGQELALAKAREGMSLSVLCPTSLIGPPDYAPSPQGQALLDVVRGRVPAVFPGGYDFLDVRDAAQAIVNAMTAAEPGEVYLLSGEFVTVKQLVQWTQEALGRRSFLPTLPFWCGYALLPVLRTGARLRGKKPALNYAMLKILEEGCRTVDSSKARTVLGLRPRPIRQSIHDTLIWFREKGYF
ncbi:MAG: NAD-dependent epimerase/dehydratase family protein [Flavobacteriales bacterium]|nr:NAD-dependent epimerase/dehydratase family protein [Flavobacteriales bacterium]MCX7649142.1 NAD-dependent epimerase/dehydratase family protein [Flavobacteriales bacterium]MDW8432441.1 NAD-dependent epimerase/dehydratase family protein [Flavobacteriales bacterium]